MRVTRRRLLSASIMVSAMTLACNDDKKPVDPDHRAAIETWRRERAARLTSDNGWLTLVGLHWLHPGDNTIGSDPDSTVVLPREQAPAQVGVIKVQGDRIDFEPKAGVAVLFNGKPAEPMALRSDAEPEPTTLTLGTLRLHVIKRGDRLAVRVKDPESPVRRHFAGLESYPVDSSWRITGTWVPHAPPHEVSVPTAYGAIEKQTSPGAIRFTRDGKSYQLDAVQESDSPELFIIFADRTNGDGTYGAGRFLYAAQPVDGQVTLDFNKAYNPPCAFTTFATCPLPPPQNRLDMRVEAGERVYTKPSS